MQPMNKEEADRFLEENPKPWRVFIDSIRCDYYAGHPVSFNHNDLLRYVAYLEQENKRMIVEVNNLVQTYKPAQLEIADHKGK